MRLRKGLASRYWEEIVLALIGCQFPGIPHNEVCGAVVSIRYSEDIVSVWNKTAHDREITDRLRDCIKKILQLPTFVHMEYKPHETSLQDKSSFRNTQVWKGKSAGGGDGERGGGGRGSGEGGSKRGMTRSGSWGNRDELRGDAGGSKHSSWDTSSSAAATTTATQRNETQRNTTYQVPQAKTATATRHSQIKKKQWFNSNCRRARINNLLLLSPRCQVLVLG